MPKNGPEIPAPLVFRVEQSIDGRRFTWTLVEPVGGTVIANGRDYERRREAKEAIRLLVRHASHAQLEDRT